MYSRHYKNNFLNINHILYIYLPYALHLVKLQKEHFKPDAKLYEPNRVIFNKLINAEAFIIKPNFTICANI